MVVLWTIRGTSAHDKTCNSLLAPCIARPGYDGHFRVRHTLFAYWWTSRRVTPATTREVSSGGRKNPSLFGFGALGTFTVMPSLCLHWSSSAHGRSIFSKDPSLPGFLPGQANHNYLVPCRGRLTTTLTVILRLCLLCMKRTVMGLVWEVDMIPTYL